jgi:hypothetical protein
MKQSLLCLAAIKVLCTSATAQDIHKVDSLLTRWVGDLVKKSSLPCNTIRIMEQDSAMKRLVFLYKDSPDTYQLHPVTHVPFDSVSMSFLGKERVNCDQVRKK